MRHSRAGHEVELVLDAEFGLRSSAVPSLEDELPQEHAEPVRRSSPKREPPASGEVVDGDALAPEGAGRPTARSSKAKPNSTDPRLRAEAGSRGARVLSRPVHGASAELGAPSGPAKRASAASSTKAKTPAPTLSPEEWLARALQADSPRARGFRARRGLACPQRLDRTTQALLLRQLSLACLEQGQFSKAAAAATQALSLGVLVDVLHQDAARAHQARGALDAAVHHLRLAERSAPAHRRSLHAWTLGATLHLAGRPREALAPLERAVRWGTTGRPLFEAHLALVRCDLGDPCNGLDAASERLASSSVAQGYGRFLLGELAWRLGRLDQAQTWLEEFLERATSGRPALVLSLDAEARRAKQTLSRIRAAQG